MNGCQSKKFVVALAVATFSCAAFGVATLYKSGQFGGKTLDDPTAYNREAFPADGFEIILYYQNDANTPYSLAGDFVLYKLYFHSFCYNTIHFPGKTLTGTNSVWVCEDSRITMTGGRIVTPEFHMESTKYNIPKRSKPRFVMNGAEAEIEATTVKVGVNWPYSSMIVSNGTCIGAFDLGEGNVSASNCMLRIVGPGSSLRVRAGSNNYAGAGGWYNVFSAENGATVSVGDNAYVYMGYDVGWGYGGGNENRFVVDNSTFAATNANFDLYGANSNRLELVNGTRAAIKRVRVGARSQYGSKNAENGKRCVGNVFRVAGVGTLADVGSFDVGWQDADNGMLVVEDGARLYSTNGIADNGNMVGYVRAANNRLVVRSGGQLIASWLELGYENYSKRNVLEIENGTCRVTVKAPNQSSIASLVMSRGEANYGGTDWGNMILMKGTNSYLKSNYTILRDNVAFEIPADGLADAKKTEAVMDLGTLATFSALVTVDVDGGCPKGKWKLMSWSTAPAGATDVSNYRIVGGGAWRSKLVFEGKSVYLDVKSDSGMTLIYR